MGFGQIVFPVETEFFAVQALWVLVCKKINFGPRFKALSEKNSALRTLRFGFVPYKWRQYQMIL